MLGALIIGTALAELTLASATLMFMHACKLANEPVAPPPRAERIRASEPTCTVWG